MKGYKFRLQNLLDLRTDMEEQCKREFKIIQKDKNELEEKHNNLKDSYSKYSSKNDEVSVVEKKIKQMYLCAIEDSIEKVKLEIKEKNKQLEEKRIELKQKQIDRKIVETLKEKKEAAFIKKQNLIEQKNNDEFALYAFIRKESI